MRPQGKLGKGDASVPSDNRRRPRGGVPKIRAEQGRTGVGHENLCLRAHHPSGDGAALCITSRRHSVRGATTIGPAPARRRSVAKVAGNRTALQAQAWQACHVAAALRYLTVGSSMRKVQGWTSYVKNGSQSPIQGDEARMFTRRLLLGSGVAASFILPAQARRRPRHPAGPVPLVMLDPGHGGKDPGAIGVSGTYEKHVALAAARELKRQLEADGRYRVELTRRHDVFIPLEGRVEIAQRKGAALFVSMHADALHDHSVRGASVYTLGTATDAQTEALARHENAADRYGGAAFRNASPHVAHILASLVREETRAGSSLLAHRLVGSFAGGDLRLLDHPDRHAGFVVLKSADIPSVLVEMGFMSNAEDEAALRQSRHRARVAGAMRQAIEAYFAHPPHTVPTRLAG